MPTTFNIYNLEHSISFLERERERETRRSIINVARTRNIIINQEVSTPADFNFSINNTQKLHSSGSFGRVEFFVLRTSRGQGGGRNSYRPVSKSLFSSISGSKSASAHAVRGIFVCAEVSASVESPAQCYAEVSASVESSAQCYEKVSTSVEASAQCYGRLSTLNDDKKRYDSVLEHIIYT